MHVSSIALALSIAIICPFAVYSYICPFAAQCLLQHPKSCVFLRSAFIRLNINCRVYSLERRPHAPSSKTVKAQLSSRYPPFECEEDYNPGHDDACKSHRGSVHGHGVDFVVYHSVNRVARLEIRVSANELLGKILGTSRTLAMKSMPPEIRQNDERSSVGGRDGHVEVGGLRYIIV